MTKSVPTALRPYIRQRTIVLRTKKRDGSWVPTPVSIVVDGERAFFRTYAKAGKTKRLRNFPDVEFAPSTVGGTPTGPTMYARATLLHGDEARHAARLLRRKHPLLHGFAVPLAHRAYRTTTLHYELSDFRQAE